jgi:hypothetical protein
MAESDYPKVALYIHPTQIEKKISEIKIEIERFHESISQTVKNYRGLYVIPVRTEHVYPIDQHVKEVVETIFETDTCTIVILWTNRDFIDAGEIFMGNMWLETDRLCEWVQHQIRG